MMNKPKVAPRDTSVMDELLLKGETDHEKINMPRPDEFVVNNRNQKLYIRAVWPTSMVDIGSLSGIVFSLHGYGSQANRPTHRYLAEQLNGQNMAYITIDFAGHGYSEGARGQVFSVDDIIDDALLMVLALFGAPTIACSVKHQIRTSQNERCPPIFFMGHSMGGGTAIAVSYLLSRKSSSKEPTFSTPFYRFHQAFIQQNIAPHFTGGVYICPVVQVSNFPRSVRDAILGLVSDLFPLFTVPFHWGDNDDDYHPSWASAKYRNYTHSDGFPHNPKGLTYADGISVRTMHSILILSDYVQSILQEIDFPFLLMHDPADTIVPYAGSLKMMQETVRVPSEQKRLVVTENMLHDILANYAIDGTKEIVSFLQTVLSTVSSSSS